jgi:hypothetical protein
MAITATTTSDLGDAVASEVVADETVATAYAAVVLDPLVKHDVVAGSLTKSYPRLVAVTAGDLVEGTDGSTTTITDTQVSATLAEIGIGCMLSDLLRVGSSIKDIVTKVTQLLGKGYAKKVESSLFALANSLTDSVGDTGTALSEDEALQSIYEVEANDGIGLMLAGLLYPKQAHNLFTAIGGVSENTSSIYGRPDILDRIGPALPNGFKCHVYGIDWFVSTNVATANTGTDSSGMVVAVGLDSPFVRTVGMLDGQPWDARYEVQRDASMRATEAWLTGAQAVAVIAPDRGCRLLSVR